MSWLVLEGADDRKVRTFISRVRSSEARACSTLLLLAGTWGNCLTLRVEEGAAVEEENEGPEWGCTLSRSGELELDSGLRQLVLALLTLPREGCRSLWLCRHSALLPRTDLCIKMTSLSST